MKLYVTAFITLFSLWFQDGFAIDDCIYYRQECEYPEEAQRPKANQWNFHRYEVYQDAGGVVRCRITGPRVGEPAQPIFSPEKDVHILRSPKKKIKMKYKARWEAEYKVTCSDAQKLSYITFTCLDIRGRDCPEECEPDSRLICRECIRISRQQFGSYEECGNAASVSGVRSLAANGYEVVFRSGKENKDNDMFVVNPATTGYHKGFEIYSKCLRAIDDYQPPMRERRHHQASAMEMVKRGCIERSGRLSTDVFPDYSAVFELNTDLDNFHREWQRMRSQQPETELIITYIHYNQTVYYMDNTISIFENGTKSWSVLGYTYGNVKVLKTFDTAGAIAYHVGRVKEIQIPYFTGPGPLVIVCNCAFFQLFAIDPRGIIPNEAENLEFKVMYTPFLDIVDPNEDVSNLDYSGNYSDDLPNIVDTMENGILNKEIEREAISTAHINKDACNFVLRAQSNATLQYFSRINETFVESLRPFTMDCGMTRIHQLDGQCITELQCTSQPSIVEEKTTCRVNDELPFSCNPFPSPVQFSEENDYITVTAINTEGRRARVVLSLK